MLESKVVEYKYIDHKNQKGEGSTVLYSEPGQEEKALKARGSFKSVEIIRVVKTLTKRVDTRTGGADERHSKRNGKRDLV
jgi:hypothetical protein